jgi:Lrp/AsnC family leucine-responsive transcriptional regulator
MVDLDLKDRKILYQLDLNCRQSNSQIGKKVGLSRKVVEYRIKRMEDEGVITGYWTNIDSYRFGYQVYRYYIVTQNATQSKKKEIIQKIADYKYTWVAAGIKGIYDLVAVIWVKSVPEFYQFWDNLNETYGDYFAEKIFSVYLQADVYPLSYLLFEDYPKEERNNPQHTGMNNPISISKEDSILLNEIATNARITLIELAEKLNCSSQAVKYGLEQLQKKKIIQGFHVGIDIDKIGYQHYKIDIWLKELSKRMKIWKYLQKNPNVTFINTSAGYADIEVEFNIENIDKLLEYMEKLQLEFPGTIRKFTYFRGNQPDVKVRCFPELTEKDFNNLQLQ